MKSILFGILLIIATRPTWAESIFVTAKSGHKIEFTQDAYKEYNKKRKFRMRSYVHHVIKNNLCQPSAEDLASSPAVQYHFACVIKNGKKPLLIFANAQQAAVYVLDDKMQAKIQSLSEYQYSERINKNTSRYIKLTLVDVQDPSNWTLFKVDFRDFDNLIEEIDNLIAELDETTY